MMDTAPAPPSAPMPAISYQAGWKYRLTERVKVALPELDDIDGPARLLHRFVEPAADAPAPSPVAAVLHPEGWTSLGHATLEIYAGCCWDGPSGPVPDTHANLGPSLVHDVLYRFMRRGNLPRRFRKAADRAYRRLLRESGVPMWRAELQYRALRLFGSKAVWSSPLDKVRQA